MLLLILELALALVGVLSAGHALLHKRDPRAAWGGVAVCLMFPGIGAALYWLMGVNRIRARAGTWKAKGRFGAEGESGRPDGSSRAGAPPLHDDPIATLIKVGNTVTRAPLLGGNRIRLLHNGEAAYPAMLDAIATARETVRLSTYIFRTHAPRP